MGTQLAKQFETSNPAITDMQLQDWLNKLGARSMDEFAGMLAHAMAHVAERHYTRALTRNQTANMAAIGLPP